MRPTVLPRTLLCLAVLAAVVLVPASPAAAHHCEYGSQATNWGHTCITPGGDGDGGGTGVSYDEMGPVFDIVMTSVDGEDCWMIAVRGGPYTWAEATDILASWDTNDVALEACEFEAVDPTPDLWAGGVCPPPAPAPLVLSPDSKALTGLAAYLQIEGAQDVQVICGDGIIEATARYVIDWGDGSPTLATTSRGGPYPDGDLRHTYQSVGSPTITVEAYWTGTIAGVTLPELPVPTSSSLTIDVDEVQAVVTSG